MITLVTLIYIISLLASIYNFIMFAIMGYEAAYSNLLVTVIVNLFAWGILIAITLKKN